MFSIDPLASFSSLRSTPNLNSMAPQRRALEEIKPPSAHPYSGHDQVDSDDREFQSPDSMILDRQDEVTPTAATSRSALRYSTGGSPKRKRSPSTSPLRLSMPSISPAQLAFSAMRFLPVPLLVLNNLKTVVLANDAMGRLLGITSEEEDYGSETSGALEKLRGQTLAQIGIDILQDGKPVWISWEALFDSLGGTGADEATDSTALEPTESGPTEGLHTKSVTIPCRPKAPKSNSEPNSVVDVVLSSRTSRKKRIKTGAAESQVYAKMIISVFEIEGHETYFTLTFTSTGSSTAPLPAIRKPVTKSSALEAAERRSIPSNPASTSSSRNSTSPSFRISPGAIAMSFSPFPPLGPPSHDPSLTNMPSILQKHTMIKDALLDNTEMPILAMWKDGSAPVANKAARTLYAESTNQESDVWEDVSFNNWEVYSDDFSYSLCPDEFPISVLLRTGKPFSGMRVGMYRKGRRIVYDVLGEVVKADNGEAVAGFVTFRDVTSMANEISNIKALDEERFRLVCDSIHQMIFTATPDGHHDYYNSRWYEYTGLTPEQSLGVGWKTPFHPDDMPQTQRKWLHSLRTGDLYETEYRCRSKAGEWRWMLGRAVPLKNRHTGKIEKWFGTCTDVHERLEANIVAKQMRQKLLSVLSHAQTTIFSVDKYANTTMLEGALLWNANGDNGAPLDELNKMNWEKYMGRYVDDVFHDLTPHLRQGGFQDLLDCIHEILEGSKLIEVVKEHEIDGHFYRTRFIPIGSKEDEPGTEKPTINGVIGVIMDVTELKEREQDLRQQAEEKRRLLANEAAAREASQLKSQFLANMSHEIRTPITGVIGMAELLLGLPLGEEQHEYANNIVRSANALLTVINDILDFSKVESGRLDIEEVQFSLSVVIQDVSKMLSFAAERKNLTFHAEIADIAQDLIVLGDPGRVRQVLTNLVTNSIKFTNNGYVKFSCQKEMETTDMIEMKFVIEDTGIGIENEVRKRLFQPFSQGDPSTARKFGGTGLGLTISKNLLDLMHGRISLDSIVGVGTTATFWIPFNKPQNPQMASLVQIDPLPDRLQSEMSCASSEEQYHVKSPDIDAKNRQSEAKLPGKKNPTSINHNGIDNDISMSERGKIRVLVVEDNAINQQIAIKTIKKLGFQVEASWNGKEALEYIEACQQGKREKPDVILMDVQMPQLDGYRATRLLRTSEKYNVYMDEIPIVAMTASAIQGDREKCTKAGMDDYLAKPVKGKLLERMLVRWSKTRRSPTSNRFIDPQGSDYSELGDQAPETAQSPLPFSLRLEPRSPTTPESNPNNAKTTAAASELKTDMLTPKPGTAVENGNVFPFVPIATGSAARQLDTKELASQLRVEKMLDVAGVGTMSPNTLAMKLSEGDSLTEENVQKFREETIRDR